MKVVILCGGMGTRMREETEFKPKPLVHIGNKPILYHIMKIYSHYGFKDFILCLGYKGEMIKKYFLNYSYMNNDFTIDLSSKRGLTMLEGDGKQGSRDHEEWSVTLADTGLKTNTGGRIKRIEKYIGDEPFLATYGDSVGDVDIKKLIDHHKSKGRKATLTGVHPLSRWGVLEESKNSLITGFKEKPKLDGWVNAGFFVFEPSVFDYLDDDCVLEKEPLENIASDKQLSVYRHDGFWQCMDTFKDQNVLEEMWEKDAPWRVWKE